jgi:Protein of unknown function (DUF1416)
VSCAAPEGGYDLPRTTSGVTGSSPAGTESVIQGRVERAGEPVRSYVRLLDGGGEFTAELPTDDGGRFRFFAAPGEWTLRTLAPKSDPYDTKVTAAQGQIAEVVIDLPAG